MVLVDCATVDTVDAEKFPLVFAVEGDEIVVDQAFLGELVLVADPVQLQTCAKVLLPPFQRFYIFCVILLQQHRGFGRGALVPHTRVGVGRVGKRFPLFAI